MELGLWIYPWDLLDGGVEPVVARLADLGVNSLAVTTIYHAGRFFLPKRASRRVFVTDPGAAFFTPTSGLYQQGWAPRQDVEVSRADLFPRLRAACAQRRVQLRAWTIGLHDQPRPGERIRNVFGDEYDFALCPSVPSTRDYLQSLVRDVAGSGCFDVIDLESYGYHGYRHFHHHERDALQMGNLEVFLLSLCFCDSCMRKAQERGIDAAATREKVAAFLASRFRHDGPGEGQHGLWQLVDFLIDHPDVYAYTRSRLASVREILERLHASMPAGTELAITSATFLQPTAAAWQEGLSLRSDLWDVTDRLVLLAYFQDPKDVYDEIYFVLDSTGAQAHRVVVGQSLFPAEAPSLGNVLEKLSIARNLGIDKVSFYNYGFLTEERLRWLEPISRAWS